MKRIVTLLGALVISLSVAACKKDSSEEVSTPTPPEESITVEPDEPEEPQLSEYEQTKQTILAYVDEAYTGMTSAQATMYFMSDFEGEFTVLVLVNADGKSYISFVGDSTVDENSGILTVRDDDTDYTFSFSVEAQAGDVLMLDCGNLGQAYLSEADPGDVMDNIMAAYETMEDVTEKLIDAVARQNFLSAMEIAYSGLTAEEAPVFFLASYDGEFAAMVMVGATGEDYISFVGTGIADEETGILTIIDDETGNRLGFIAEAQEDGSLYLNCGNIGECYLLPDEAENVVDYIDIVYRDLEDVTNAVLAQLAN